MTRRTPTSAQSSHQHTLGRATPQRRRDQRAAARHDTVLVWGKTALLGVILFWCLFPFFWLIMTSLKQGDRALNSPNLFQGPFGVQNYVAVFAQHFHLNLRNSLIVAGMTTLFCVGIGSLGAYAL